MLAQVFVSNSSFQMKWISLDFLFEGFGNDAWLWDQILDIGWLSCLSTWSALTSFK